MVSKAGLVMIAAASVFALPSAGAQAAWRQVYADRDVRVLFDTASAKLSSPGVWTTVTSWDYSRPRFLENKKSYTRLVERVHIRCSPVRVKRVRSTVYGANNSIVRDEGEVDIRDQAAMAWDQPRRATAAASAFNSVCNVLARKPAAKKATTRTSSGTR